MSYDGKILSRALERYEEQINRQKLERKRRNARILTEIPRLREIETQLRTSVIDAARAALSAEDAPGLIEKARRANLELQRERAELLTAHGYPFDCLSDTPFCEQCGDTGFIGSEMCACLRTFYHAEQVRELSDTLNLAGCTFDDFSFDLYDAQKDPARKISPRDNIEYVFDTCTDFARTFGRHRINLFMRGGAGLGKTFLAACIANAVIERGFSVVYETAGVLFSRFDDERFRRGDDSARADVRRYHTCDLLILDDLGTEPSGSYAPSCLYQLLNARLSAGRQCIVITNLGPEELKRRYMPQILSRLEGEYTDLIFFGEDIRLRRKRGI